MQSKIKILFVCHGNICRSPMAEFILKDMAVKRGLSVSFDGAEGHDVLIESAATSTEEIGNPVYPPAKAKLAEHGIGIPGNELGVGKKRARQMTKTDYDDYDYIIFMDRHNIRNARRFIKGDPDGKASMLLDFCGRTGEQVADPWYTDDFDATWDDCVEGCSALLDFLEQNGELGCHDNNDAGNGEDADKGAAGSLEWEELSREHIVEDKWIDFRRSRYRFPDGREFEPFYSYSRRDYVVIVATDEEGRYICVRQFRQGIKEVTTEFPAGGIERSDGREYDQARSTSGTDSTGDHAADPDIVKAEDPLLTAKRELREETGYISDEWKHLMTIPSSATVSDNLAHIYMAGNCRKSGEKSLDETEFLNEVLLTEAELKERIFHGDFKQAVHIMAWLLAKDQRGQE